MSKLLHSLFLILLSLSATKCTFFRETIGYGYLKPSIFLDKIEVKKITLEAAECFITISIFNPNDYDLKFSQLFYQLNFKNKKVAFGSKTEEINIPEKTKTPLRFQLTIDPQYVLFIAQEIIKSKENTLVELSVQANFLTPLGIKEIMYQREFPVSTLIGL